MMGRFLSAGRMLAVLRLALFGLALWITAFQSVPSAQAGQEMCAAPANLCGCLTCGCPGTSIPREPSCPPGQIVYDGFCLPGCPDGWQRYPGYPGLCLPPCHHGCPEGYDQVPLPQCPDGYHRDIRNPNYCVPDFDQPGYDDCPAGMVLSPQTEQCVVDCPEGTYASEDGLCRSYYERECPQGFGRDPETGRCIPPGIWPPGYEWICLPQCPDGYVRDIERPTRCIPPPPECPQGYERSNGRCEPICEEGTQRDPYGYCVPQRCPDGSYPNLRGQCEEPDCPQGYDNIRGQCLPQCPEEYSRDDNGRCVPPDEGCPEGTETINGQCMPLCPPEYKRDRQTGRCIPPGDGCKQGEELLRGKCVPPCANGTVRDNNGRCVPQGCPTGTEKFQGQCLPLCRDGLERNSKGRCVCPAGTDFIGGRCVDECKQGLVRDKNGRCVPRACAEGEERVQGRCVPQCRSSFVRGKNGKCVCPRGTELGRTSGRCEKVVEQRECPKGYRRNENGECERIRRAQPACPEGYYYSKRYQKCLPEEDDTPEPPPVRVPRIELDPDVLEKLIPQNPSRLQEQQGGEDCPKGYYRDNNGRCVKG